MSDSHEALQPDRLLTLPEFDAPPSEPLGLLRRWIAEARGHGVREPMAFALSTAGRDAELTTRIVLLKDVDAQGLIFTTHLASRKGSALRETGRASGVLFWRETLQQITVSGSAIELRAKESDALFAQRPRAAQATTIASQQSAELRDERALRARAAAIEAGDGVLERPAGWAGYRLVPREVEFWHGSADRLHRRLHYRREPPGWSITRLQP